MLEGHIQVANYKRQHHYHLQGHCFWKPTAPGQLNKAVFLQASLATMSLWQSYRALAPRTRLFIGGGIMAYAALGLLASDQAEQLLGWTATEEDRKRLKDEMPKVHVVDRFNK